MYVAIVWVACLVATIIWIVVLFMASLLPSWTGGGTPRDPPLDHAPWSREARSIGLSDHSMWVQLNACFQITTGLFTYLNTIVTPWRLSILIHHHSRRRSAAVGRDFYDRETAALWFQIPTRSRGVIAWCLCLSVFFHFATQVNLTPHPPIRPAPHAPHPPIRPALHAPPPAPACMSPPARLRPPSCARPPALAHKRARTRSKTGRTDRLRASPHLPAHLQRARWH